MPLEDILKGKSIPAVVAGIGLAALVPLLFHGATGNSRPLAKALLHKYLDWAEKFKELGAEAQEQWGDLLAEVHAERQTVPSADGGDVGEIESHVRFAREGSDHA